MPRLGDLFSELSEVLPASARRKSPRVMRTTTRSGDGGNARVVIAGS